MYLRATNQNGKEERSAAITKLSPKTCSLFVSDDAPVLVGWERRGRGQLPECHLAARNSKAAGAQSARGDAQLVFGPGETSPARGDLEQLSQPPGGRAGAGHAFAKLAAVE